MTKTEKEIEDMDFFDKVQDAFDLDDRMTDYIRQMYDDLDKPVAELFTAFICLEKLTRDERGSPLE
mgnify:CR=1 FL=1